MEHIRFIDGCFLFFTTLIVLLLVVRAIVLIFFMTRYGYDVPFIMLFYWFPYTDVKNTFHSRIKFLKKVYNRTTIPFLIVLIVIIGLKVFLHLIDNA